jgi:NSS family neurotransmitter:Na+ symporter
MAGGAGRRTFLMALFGSGLAVSLARFPLGRATHGAWFFLVSLAGFLALGLPLLLSEAALGQFRRRNTVDGFGPGPWKGLGFVPGAGAVLAAALLAVLAGWAARLVADSATGDGFSDPDRHIRLLTAGPDALLWTLGVLAVTTGLSMRGARRGLHGLIAAFAVVAAAIVAGLAVWANLQGGAGAGRTDLFGLAGAGVNASFVTAALLAGLLPALLATGMAAALAAHVHERTLPREVAVLAIALATALFAALLFLAGLSGAQHHPLGGVGGLQAFTQAPSLFGQVGGVEGGVLQGLFFGAVLLASVVAILALLEVPTAWLTERFDSWTEGRSSLASGLLAYLVAVPFCFSLAGAQHLDQGLAWVLAPFAGLLVSSHIGWARSVVLDGFKVGEAGHRLDRTLGPVLRYLLPPAFAVLLTAGLLGFIRAMDWAHGSGGLWALAP